MAVFGGKIISLAALAGAGIMLLSTAAQAEEPGLGEKVYGATVEKGVTEIEARYGRLTGGEADGEEGHIYELEHGFSRRLAAALVVELEREEGGARRVRGIGGEAIFHLAHIKPLKLDVAAYGEYLVGLKGEPDEIESKLLLQHRAGGFDARFNFNLEKELAQNEPVEFSYAASADWAVVGDFRLGFEAFGGLGSGRKFLARESHYIGPVAKFEIEKIGPGELEIQASWLRGFGAARDEADGQARVQLSYEFHF